jgi:hypothetical protein
MFSSLLLLFGKKKSRKFLGNFKEIPDLFPPFVFKGTSERDVMKKTN